MFLIALTNLEIVEFHKQLVEFNILIQKLKVNPKCSYFVYRNANNFAKSLSRFEDKKSSAVVPYLVKDEKGGYKVDENKELVLTCPKEELENMIEALLKESNEVELYFAPNFSIDNWFDEKEIEHDVSTSFFAIYDVIKELVEKVKSASTTKKGKK